MQTENLHHKLELALGELATLLNTMGLWSAAPPSAAALASHDPFCCDSMNLEAWLQWVFIPRIATLLNNNQPLPLGCNISPYAEETIGKLPNSVPLLAHIRYIDMLMNTPRQ